MRLIPRTVLSAALVDQGVVFVRVQLGLGRARVQRLGHIANLSGAASGEIRAAAGLGGRASGKGAGGRSEFVVTCPSSICFVKPVALDRPGFVTAREEIERSVEELFPIAPGDAMLGFIERAGSAAQSEGSGYLVAARRSRLQPSLEQLGGAVGSPARRVLSPLMALPGLGLQSIEHARIAEPTQSGRWSVHTLSYGRVAQLGEPASGAEGADGVLPRGLSGEDLDRAYALAEAAALLPEVAPGDVVPLAGARARGPVRWALPAAGLVAAALLVVAALALSESRYRAATADIQRDQQRIAAEVASVQEQRAELTRLAGLLNAARSLGVETPSRIIPDAAEATALLPDEAFLNSFLLTPNMVELRGVAPRAREVLQALQGSAAFADARPLADPLPIGAGSELESFSVTARRRSDSPRSENGGGS